MDRIAIYKQQILAGASTVGGFKVKIESRFDFRYIAYLSNDVLTTVVETPTTSNTEGILTFADRVASKICDLTPKGDVA